MHSDEKLVELADLKHLVLDDNLPDSDSTSTKFIPDLSIEQLIFVTSFCLRHQWEVYQIKLFSLTLITGKSVSYCARNIPNSVEKILQVANKYLIITKGHKKIRQRIEMEERIKKRII